MSEPTRIELLAAYEVLKRHVDLWGEYAEEKRFQEEKQKIEEGERMYKLGHWTDEPLTESEILDTMTRDDSQATLEQIMYLIWEKNIADYTALLKECAALSPIAYAICHAWKYRFTQECQDRQDFGDEYLDVIYDEVVLDEGIKAKIRTELETRKK